MKTRTRTLTAAVAAGLTMASVVALSTSAHATGKTTLSSNEALGLGDNGRTLRIFELNDPEDDDYIGPVTGLSGEEARGFEGALIGIDYRVQDDTFYGVGELGGIYTLNTRTGAATLVSAMTIPPEGEHFGVDFDPDDGKLHVISDTGQNLEHNLDTDTSEDQGVTVPAGVTGIAYTNNDLAEDTGTSLFDIHVPAVLVFQQIQTPNEVVLSFTGSPGLDSIGGIVGFDVQSKLSSGRTVSNTGYASLRRINTAQPDLYKVDLLSGKATKVDDFDKQIADIAVKQP